MLFHEKIVFSTNNLKEIRLAISHFEVVGLKDISINEDIPETGNTLKANALQKAKYIYDKTALANLSLLIPLYLFIDVLDLKTN